MKPKTDPVPGAGNGNPKDFPGNRRSIVRPDGRPSGFHEIYVAFLRDTTTLQAGDHRNPMGLAGGTRGIPWSSEMLLESLWDLMALLSGSRGEFWAPTTGCPVYSSGTPHGNNREPAGIPGGNQVFSRYLPRSPTVAFGFPRGVSPAILRDTRGNTQEPTGIPGENPRDAAESLGSPWSVSRVPLGYQPGTRGTSAGNTRETREPREPQKSQGIPLEPACSG